MQSTFTTSQQLFSASKTITLKIKPFLAKEEYLITVATAVLAEV